MKTTTKKPTLKAWQLIKTKNRWCKSDFAQTKEGLFTRPTEQDAYKFCARGAMRRVYDNTETNDAYKKAFVKLAKLIGVEPVLDYDNLCAIGNWNNTNDHATVLATMKKANI